MLELTSNKELNLIFIIFNSDLNLPRDIIISTEALSTLGMILDFNNN